MAESRDRLRPNRRSWRLETLIKVIALLPFIFEWRISRVQIDDVKNFTSKFPSGAVPVGVWV